MLNGATYLVLKTYDVDRSRVLAFLVALHFLSLKLKTSERFCVAKQNTSKATNLNFNTADYWTNVTELAQISRLTRNDDDEKILRSMNKQGSREHNFSIDVSIKNVCLTILSVHVRSIHRKQ